MKRITRLCLTAGALGALAVAIPTTAQAAVLGTQHTASGQVSSSAACSLNITVAVLDQGDNAATFTVALTGRPAGVGPSDVTTYIGFGEGNFVFNNFAADPGESLNGTYTFTVNKTAGDGTPTTNPVPVTVNVSDLPTCGVHIVVNKITEGGFGGPFDFTITTGNNQSLFAEASGSTTQADTVSTVYDGYGPGGSLYSVNETFTVGDPDDPTTWTTDDGFMPISMYCEQYNADGELVWSNESDPSDAGVMGNGATLQNGDTFECVAYNGLPGSITIAKATPGATDTPDFSFDIEFDQTYNWGFDIAGGEEDTLSGLRPGVYTITEDALQGWQLDDIDCGEVKAKIDVDSGVVLLIVSAGQNVVCTFTNSSDGSSGSGAGLPTVGSDAPGTLMQIAIALVLVGGVLGVIRRRPWSPYR